MTELVTCQLHITGMDCADCARHIQEAVQKIPGVAQARVNFALGTLHVSMNNATLLPQVRQQVQALGYGIREVHPQTPQVSSLLDWLRTHPRDRLALVAGLLIALGLWAEHGIGSHPAAQALFALAILAGGYYVARAGWATLRATHRLDMNALMTIAAVGALAIGEGAEGAVTMFLFAVGNALEGYTVERARGAIRSLMALAPDEAIRLGAHSDAAQERVAVEQLQVGDRILVRPGERVPMDGIVLIGTSTVDQSPITGESVPIVVHRGSEVFAGSINGNGALVVRVTRPAGENTIARIIRLVEEAQAQRAPTQRFVDAFAARYTPAVIALAVLVAVVPPLVLAQPFVTWLYRALVLLVIACPCALVISTPVSIVSALARAARQGVLIKGGAYLEAVGTLRALAFDKTATLTTGKPTVTNVIPLNGFSADETLALAASIESQSTHPLAEAIVHEAQHRGLALQPVAHFTALTGLGAQGQIHGAPYRIGGPHAFKGNGEGGDGWRERMAALQAEGKTAVLLGDAKGPVGIIALADTVRPEAAAAIAALWQVGIEHIALLSGDHPQAARAIAAQVGVDDVRAGLMPEEKVAAVSEYLQRYGRVGMVGDGVNDAPALARATVGFAMGAAGTAQALETADIALMGDDLSKLPFTIRLSRQARRTIRQNIVISLGLKAIFLALALPGLATLWMAVFADMGASLIVTLNGMRLLRGQEKGV